HFIDLGKMVNGFSPSNLMILAARPAMGKTALALNIAENMCFQNQLPIGIFSLEMTVDQLIHRIICSRSEVESRK
ncbi:dnaB-like helicase N terminal domain protein, partial [Chlamydia psittaci 06-1683]